VSCGPKRGMNWVLTLDTGTGRRVSEDALGRRAINDARGYHKCYYQQINAWWMWSAAIQQIRSIRKRPDLRCGLQLASRAWTSDRFFARIPFLSCSFGGGIGSSNLGTFCIYPPSPLSRSIPVPSILIQPLHR
jgi:hypothetical protein